MAFAIHWHESAMYLHVPGVFLKFYPDIEVEKNTFIFRSWEPEDSRMSSSLWQWRCHFRLCEWICPSQVWMWGSLFPSWRAPCVWSPSQPLHVPRPGGCLWLCPAGVHNVFVKRRSTSQRPVIVLSVVCYYCSLLHHCMMLLQCVFLEIHLEPKLIFTIWKNRWGTFHPSVRKPNPGSLRQSRKLLAHKVWKVQCYLKVSLGPGLKTLPELCHPVLSSFLGCLWWQDGWQRFLLCIRSDSSQLLKDCLSKRSRLGRHSPNYFICPSLNQ